MTTTLDQHDEVVRRFAEACRRGDTVELQGALDLNAIAVCDGGGVAAAASGLVYGAVGVAELALALLCGQPGDELTVEAVNGRAGLAVRRAAGRSQWSG
jgi:RNA polymerase sigma-70 factor (ECF subfamily)